MNEHQRIAQFATNPDMVMLHLGMLKVGHEKGDRVEVIMERIIASVLMHYLKIPLKTGQS